MFLFLFVYDSAHMDLQTDVPNWKVPPTGALGIMVAKLLRADAFDRPLLSLMVTLLAPASLPPQAATATDDVSSTQGPSNNRVLRHMLCWKICLEQKSLDQLPMM